MAVDHEYREDEPEQVECVVAICSGGVDGHGAECLLGLSRSDPKTTVNAGPGDLRSKIEDKLARLPSIMIVSER